MRLSRVFSETKKPFIFSWKDEVQEAKKLIFDGFKIDNERRES
jgi:hypothetical protein